MTALFSGGITVKCHHVIVFYGNYIERMQRVRGCLLVPLCRESLARTASTLKLIYGSRRGSKRMLQSLIINMCTYMDCGGAVHGFLQQVEGKVFTQY